MTERTHLLGAEYSYKNDCNGQENNVIRNANKSSKLFDNDLPIPSAHKHVMGCWKSKGELIGQTNPYWQEDYAWKEREPILVVKDCSTKINSCTISLDLGIQLKTDVSVYTNIDKVENGVGQNGNITYENEIPNIVNPILDGAEGSTVFPRPYTVNDRNCGHTEACGTDCDPSLQHAEIRKTKNWRSERWKNIEKVAVTEAGDRLTYMVTLLNNDPDPIAVKIEDILPQNKIDRIEIYQVNPNKQSEVWAENKNIRGKPKLLTEDFPINWAETNEKRLAVEEGDYENDNGYIKLPSLGCLTWKIVVNINTAEDAYEANERTQNTIKITDVRRGDKQSNEAYYHNHVANIAELGQDGRRIKSKDSFICKMYNVVVDKAITNVQRNSGSNLLNGEYTVDNENYTYQDDKRKNKTDDEKNKNPIYIENGDVVTYTITVKNRADEESIYINNEPYYNPNKVTVSLEDKFLANGKIYKDKDNSTDNPIWAEKQKSGASKWEKMDLKYNENTKMFDNFTLENGETVRIKMQVLSNNSKTAPLIYNNIRENTVNIKELKNINGKTTTRVEEPSEGGSSGVTPDCAYHQKYRGQTLNGGQILNNVEKDKATSSDYFRIKEYNVVIDKYISDVSHVESRGGTQTTYHSEGRISGINTENGSGSEDIKKEGNPVSVEYGDRVTYKIQIYNTTNNNYYNIGRGNAPYKQPQYVYVDIKDTLPEKYSDLRVNGNAVSVASDGKLYLNNVKVPANGITTITVSLVVEESTKNWTETNTAEIYNPVRNINQYNIINNGKRLKVSDKYQLNDYNATLEEYIDTYNAEMAKYNNGNGFTSGESEGFSNGTTSYSNEAPLDLEKYETLTYATKVTNRANGGEEEENSGNYAKYNTRVRPTDITQTLDYGLELTGFKAIWYDAQGKEKTWIDSNGIEHTDGDITSSIETGSGDLTTTKQVIYKYTINDENIILSPEEYIIYYTTVKVTESNLCLKNLKCSSKIETLTNVNRNTKTDYGTNNGVDTENGHKRIITNQNLADESQKSDSDYVRLKDVIIAGQVFLDDNRNGLNDDGENGSKKGEANVTVKLYGDDGKNNGSYRLLDTRTTDEKGVYKFPRQWKANGKDYNVTKNYTNTTNYIKYYLEFEYDGVKYKATEVYGGDSDGNADGMENLWETVTVDEKESPGKEKWRQGYDGLPGIKSGNKEYTIDSNAYEFDDVRNDFDSHYATIGFNKSYKGTNANRDLEYTKQGHVSTLNEDSNRVMKARSFIQQDYSKEEGVNGLKEDKGLNNTNTLFLYNYGGHHNEYPETEYLKFINLGLVEREKTDISIESDVHSVKTTINGEEMTYEFGKNDADSTKDNYSTQTNAYKLKEAYNLDLYKSDFNYRNDTYYDENTLKDYKGNESELTAEVTYRTRITNNAITNDVPSWEEGKRDIPIETAINEMAVYYDANFISKETVEAYLNEKTTVKDKKDDTGLFENKVFNSIRVNYGTKEELDQLNNLNSLKVLTAEQQAQLNALVSKTDIRDQIRFTSRYSNNKVPNDAVQKGYNVLYLTGDKMDKTYLKEGKEESRYIQLTFVVNKDTARKLLIDDTKENNMGLEVITEISEYTTRYSEDYKHKGLAGKYAGLIDRDSNPGNLNLNGIENYDNYEDDKYKVGVKVGLLDDTRSVSGFVWDDARNETVGTAETGIQYLGNGEYNAENQNNTEAKTNPNDRGVKKDKLIPGVKVSLIEVIQTENGKYYESPARYTYDVKDSTGRIIHSKGSKIEAITNENGEYTLSNYIPGYYKVRFDYGYDKGNENNILYNGQDYKSTAYYNEYANEGEATTTLYYNTNQDYNDNDYIGAAAQFKYFDKVKETLEVANKSDAQDDEIRRLNVNSYAETMTTSQGKIFSETSVTKAKELERITDSTKKQEVKDYLEENDKKLIDNTHMYAESTIFYTKPENVESAETNISATADDFNTNRLWKIDHLDFGLEYRPESSIVLDKNIDSLELVTSDNKTLVKLYFKDDENGKRVVNEKKSKGYENVQFLANDDKKQQGFVYLNMDTDILEGATIKVDYGIDSENCSEVDRINKNLDAIKFETGANTYGAGFKVYTSHNASNNMDDSLKYTYNANATAAQVLASQYLDGESYQKYRNNVGKDDDYKYLKKIKKSYICGTGKKTTITGGPTLTGQEYYGMYLGETYYTGEVGDNDKVAELKVDHILDYIDNDFTFDLSENNTKDRLWQTTTSKELKDRKLLDFGKVNTDNQDNLIDQYGIRYDTDNRSNLALSVDDNKSGNYWKLKSNGDDEYTDRNGNVSLSRFLKVKNAVKDSKKNAEKYTGTINAIATKVLSADDVTIGKGLSYNNIAEVVQYTSLTGRRTTLPDGNGNGGVIGNANVSDSWTGYLKSEDDTDATEVITISPPTGLNGLN